MAVDPVAAARYFVQTIGCTVFPVWGSRDGRCNCGDPHDGTGKHQPENVGKHPATMNGFKDGTADPKAIERFLANPGTPNYGLNAAPGILVVDVDGPGLETWERLQHEHGPLPVTLTTTTANGRHYWFRWPEHMGPMPVGKLFGFVVRRHDDGYVIGPGSVHPSGVQYDTLRQPDGHPYAIATLPDAWAKAATAHDDRSDPGTITIDAGGYRLPEHGYSGARYDEIVRYTASRYIRGLDKDEIWAGVVDVLAPRFAVPLTEPELRSRFDRAWANTPRRLGPPMEPRQDPETGEVRMAPPEDFGSAPLYGPEDDESLFPSPVAEAAFGGVIGECVWSLLDGTDASSVGILASLISFCGALMPAHGYWHGTHTSTPFLALVGKTGIGRKGTAMYRVRDAIGNAIGMDVVNRARFDGLASGEALVKALLDRSRDPSTYGVPNGVLFEEEYATFLSAAGRDNSNLDSRMRQAFDGKQMAHRQRSETMIVPEPYYLSGLVAITPEELQGKAKKDQFKSGSANRWLWLPVVRRDVLVESTPPVLPAELSTALRDAHLENVRTQPETGRAPGVDALLSEYDAYLRSESVGMAADMTRRYAAIAFRCALVHAAVERSRHVTKDHCLRSIALAEYARSGLDFAFGEALGDRASSLLLRMLKAEGGVLSQGLISKHFIKDMVRRQDAVDDLCRLGLAEVVRVRTTGRTRTELRLTPQKGPFRDFRAIFGGSAQSTPPDMAEKARKRLGEEEGRGAEGARKGREVPVWRTPCRDYTNHQDNHRQTPDGWVCDACEEGQP